MKKLFTLIIAFIVVISLLVLFKFIVGYSKDRINDGAAAQAEEDKTSPSSNDAPKPFIDIFNEDNYTEELSRKQYHHKPEKIHSETSPKDGKRKTFIRPEETVEDYSLKDMKYILGKLRDGTIIEQRKVANELWARFGLSQAGLSKTEQEMIAIATERYLVNIKDDFEESFMQIQRLWHLAVPALLKNVTVQDISVSENAARLLSVMKTPQIIDKLISDSNKAQSHNDIEKYIFALEYMKINNRYFLDNRSRMSDSECDAYYNDHVYPQVIILKQRLLKIENPLNQ